MPRDPIRCPGTEKAEKEAEDAFIPRNIAEVLSQGITQGPLGKIGFPGNQVAQVGSPGGRGPAGRGEGLA